MKTLIEIHALQNFAPSNLNRDDTGAPKDALFGGTRRARISSQCSKKAVRDFFEAKTHQGIFIADELATRTKRLHGELQKILVGLGRPETSVENKIKQAIAATGLGLKGEKTEYLLFLGKTEIAGLARLIDEKWDEIGDAGARIQAIKNHLKNTLSEDEEKQKAVFQSLKLDGDKPKIKEEEIVAIEGGLDQLTELLAKYIDAITPLASDDNRKPAKRKKSDLPEWEKEIQDILKEGKKGVSPLGKALRQVLDGGKAVDLALFGRMLADMPEKNQYAACQVAHSISTHTVEREFDFYTAVDQLRPEDTAGADMMGTIEFNSACFYRYAVIDWEKLVSNLQGDVALAEKGLRAFLEGFVIAEPTGKQNTFAAHNPPEFVALSVRKNGAPRNFANAFEIPIYAKRGESVTRKSAESLINKAINLNNAYGKGSDKTHILNLVDAEVSGYGVNTSSLEELLSKTMTALKE